MLASKSTIGKEPSGAGAGGCVTQSRSTRSRLELGVEECVTVRRDFARGDEHEERVVRRRHDVAVALEAQAYGVSGTRSSRSSRLTGAL